MSRENDIQKNVLERIHAGHVSMHSKWYFALREGLFDAALVFVFLLSLFMLSLVFFSLRESNEPYVFVFGAQGLSAFASLFRWLLFLASIVLLAAFEALLRHFKFGYRRPLLRLFFWVAVAGIAGAIVLQQISLHDYLLKETERGRLPVLGPLYERVRDAR